MSPPPARRASVIIPAHNEARVIGRLLDALEPNHSPLQLIVVCNGCSDATASVARLPGVEVAEIAEASKQAALTVGDELARHHPRVYLDADVQITADSVLTLVEAVSDGTILAAGPRRIVPREQTSRVVSWYYDVWERLPQVRTGLFGRGVIAVSEVGHRRVRSMPALMGDDLVASEAFVAGERTVVDDATVIVHPPRTAGDLVRRRVRAATVNAQADQYSVRRSDSTTTWASLARMGKHEPGLAPKILLFLGVTAVARMRARRSVRRGDFRTWLRDESSRG